MRNPSEAARDPEVATRLLDQIRTSEAPSTVVMEVCGTHTVTIAKLGLRSILPGTVRLLSGPGCPVCVTPVATFDEAVHLVSETGVVLATYGDALRVPGSETTLAEARANGGDVRVVYSVLDALELARRESGREVVFLGLGFETTSPTVAWAVKRARSEGLTNFSVLAAHKALLPAMDALARDGELAVDAFLCPGHASMILGAKAYEPLVEKYGIGCVIAGFEANDVLLGLLRVLRQRERSEAKLENAYPRAVDADGNRAARAVLDEVFTRVDSRWRGLGELPGSGYELSEAYDRYDARRRFLEGLEFRGKEPSGCRCPEVLQGRLSPWECGLFGSLCTPRTPVGACMVSSEGACGAHYRYREV